MRGQGMGQGGGWGEAVERSGWVEEVRLVAPFALLPLD